MTIDNENDNETWTDEDEDYGLVADYVFDEMEEEERQAFERRLATDAEFHALAMPLICALRLPRPQMPSAADVEEHWQQFARAHGLPVRSPEVEAEERLRNSIDRLRREKIGPEHAANRPPNTSGLPDLPFMKESEQ